MTESEATQGTEQTEQEVGVTTTTERAAKGFVPVPPLPLPSAPEDLHTSQMVFSEEDVEQFLHALKRSKQELDIARQQFENVTDQRLIDHVVFRLGAAERHFSYLLQLARQWGLAVNGIRWDWSEEA